MDSWPGEEELGVAERAALQPIGQLPPSLRL